MTVISKARGILKLNLTNHINKEIAASAPSIYQVTRCKSSSVLFVGGISSSIDDASLKELCSSYGEVTQARVVTDRESGMSRNFGFVNYASAEDAARAIQALDLRKCHGHTMRVQYAAYMWPARRH